MKFLKWHLALVVSDVDMNAVYRAGRQIGLLAPGWHARKNPERKNTLVPKSEGKNDDQTRAAKNDSGNAENRKAD